MRLSQTQDDSNRPRSMIIHSKSPATPTSPHCRKAPFTKTQRHISRFRFGIAGSPNCRSPIRSSVSLPHLYSNHLGACRAASTIDAIHRDALSSAGRVARKIRKKAPEKQVTAESREERSCVLDQPKQMPGLNPRLAQTAEKPYFPPKVSCQRNVPSVKSPFFRKRTHLRHRRLPLPQPLLRLRQHPLHLKPHRHP